MPNDNYTLGHGISWNDRSGRSVREEDCDSERSIDEDSLASELAKRAFIASCRAKDSKFKACELLALLPECPKTNKSIDEIVLEGMSIIELI